MTQTAELTINPDAARAKLRRMHVAAESQNERLRALSRRYSELTELRGTLARAALPPPPATDEAGRVRPNQVPRSRVSAHDPSELAQLDADEWRARYADEQRRLRELDAEIEAVLAERDALAASWAAAARVIQNAKIELVRRTGRRFETF